MVGLAVSQAKARLLLGHTAVELVNDGPVTIVLE